MAHSRPFTMFGNSTDGSLNYSSPDLKSGSCEALSGVTLRHPPKNRARNRHSKRFSQVFGRVSGSHRDGLTERDRTKKSCENINAVTLGIGGPVADTNDSVELSTQTTAPGVLKIFGGEISSGANYKSVLATPTSSARELVKEALERYSLDRERAADYVLCEVIGKQSGSEGTWRVECLRLVANHEKPLLLQALWKPRDGYSRRYELRLRTKVEELSANDSDTLTAGINAQARRLQMSRARKSTVHGMTPSMGSANGGYAEWISSSDLRRTVSDMQIPLVRKDRPSPALPRQARVEGVMPSPAAPHRPVHFAMTMAEESCPQCGVRESEETESSDDNCSQFSMHPPVEAPYLLLLQGYDNRQDFLVYLMSGQRHVIGREHGSGDDKNDIILVAPDILPRHCRIGRSELCGTGPITLQPFRRARVTHNGAPLERQAILRPGDLVGLGEHYLFIYHDATQPQQKTRRVLDPAFLSSWPRPPDAGMPCRLCGVSAGRSRLQARPSGEGSRSVLLLEYDPALEDLLLDSIAGLVEPGGEEYQLTPAHLLCLCAQHAAFALQPEDLRRLLLKIASLLQTTAWEKTKELAEKQPDQREQDDGSSTTVHDLEGLVTDLRPVVFWMANSIEVLHFLQQRIPEYVREVDESQGDGPQESVLTSALSACEEAITVVEEVVMYTFQQTVYYLTKALYTALPGLLDSNPFAMAANSVGDGRLSPPEGVQKVLAIYQATKDLLASSALHPDIASQLFAYLFFFSNASLFNSLMERGCRGGYYHWSRGVQLRANLDLVLEWLQEANLGDLASEFFRKLSTSADLLATPKLNLMQQASWRSLRVDFPALSPAQLHHFLREYQLGPSKTVPQAWQPDSEDSQAAYRTVEVLESFENHPPLVLPSSGFQVDLDAPAPSSDFARHLQQLREMLHTLGGKAEVSLRSGHSPTEPRSPVNVNNPNHVGANGYDDLPEEESSELQEAASAESDRAVEEAGAAEAVPQAMEESAAVTDETAEGSANGGRKESTGGSRRSLQGDMFGPCQAELAHKLQQLELQSLVSKRQDQKVDTTTFDLDPSCLLTPPNSPMAKESLDKESVAKDNPKMADASQNDTIEEDKSSGNNCAMTSEPPPSCDSKKANEEENGEDEVFVVELSKGPKGLGMGLIDGMYTRLRVPGIYIKTLVPETPATRSGRLTAGDRILAVNGSSLAGVGYQSAMDLIRSGGDTVRLLIAKVDSGMKISTRL
uniref:ras-associating and dilute domain-containing protein-like isoform X1 n=1 Tax=Myxine glutinosa TaxID=7769 RepID=UPI0035902BE5